jgi:hypothetical protein
MGDLPIPGWDKWTGTGCAWAATAWVLCTIACGAAPAMDPAMASAQPQDLTGMSLEGLLHEEIVPINVLGNHTHLKGEIMVGYAYMFMDMGHNQEGARDVSQGEVLLR